jgi:hypothetical protein
MLAVEYGPGGRAERPDPRLSNATVRYRLAKAGIWPRQPNMGVARPMMRRTGGASSGPDTS